MRMLYDITPLDTTITGATFTQMPEYATISVNKINHGLSAGDIFISSTTAPPGSGYVDTDLHQLLLK